MVPSLFIGLSGLTLDMDSLCALAADKQILHILHIVTSGDPAQLPELSTEELPGGAVLQQCHLDSEAGVEAGIGPRRDVAVRQMELMLEQVNRRELQGCLCALLQPLAYGVCTSLWLLH